MSTHNHLYSHPPFLPGGRNYISPVEKKQRDLRYSSSEIVSDIPLYELLQQPHQPLVNPQNSSSGTPVDKTTNATQTKEVNTVFQRTLKTGLTVTREDKIYWYSYSGFFYKGEILKEIPHGVGEAVYHTKEEYRGEFEFGRPHGAGVYTFKSGYQYFTQFRYGQPLGGGILTDNRENVIFPSFGTRHTLLLLDLLQSLNNNISLN